jgi:hypothetical protein
MDAEQLRHQPARETGAAGHRRGEHGPPQDGREAPGPARGTAGEDHDPEVEQQPVELQERPCRRVRPGGREERPARECGERARAQTEQQAPALERPLGERHARQERDREQRRDQPGGAGEETACTEREVEGREGRDDERRVRPCDTCPLPDGSLHVKSMTCQHRSSTDRV